MSTAEDNKAKFIWMYDEVNKGNNDAIDEVLADDFVNHEGGMPPQPGKAAFKDFQVSFAKAFPDFNYRLDELIVDDDHVAVHATVSGTQLGEFMGMPPTGKHAEWTGTAICRFVDGKVVERHHVADIGGMLIQLGVLPPPTPPVTLHAGGVVRRDVTFLSEGMKCAGWLFVPEALPAGEKAPGIVLANGFSTIKEIYMKDYAERFAGAGFVVLAFDYRHFGESEGEPRNQLFPNDELQDVRNALSFLATQPEVEPTRLGAWGVSLGGGHVMYLAAFDRRLKAVVAQVPAINQFENFRTMLPPPAFAGLIKMLNDDRQERYSSGEVRYLKLVAPAGEQALMPEEAYEFYMTAQSTVAPTWRNEITIESLEKFLEYDPCGPIHMVAPTAVQMIVGEQDAIIPPELAKLAFERAGEPKALKMIPGRHVDMYPGYPYFEDAVTTATDWFVKYLGSN